MSGGCVSGTRGARLFALSMSVIGGVLALAHFADPAMAADRLGSSGGVFVSEMK